MDLSLSQLAPLTLLESPDADGRGGFNADGSISCVIMRPCEARGPGHRIYTREVCERSAPSFAGLPSYLNHRDPRAKQSSPMIRRGPDELAGEIQSAWWHPTFTTPDDAKHGYQPGAVVGRFMPANDLVESLIRRIPSQLKLSVNTSATSLRPARRRDGKPGQLVEGIDNDPERSSVDLVTAAGAGGHVAALIESVGSGSGRPRPASSQTNGGKPMGPWIEERRRRQNVRSGPPRIPYAEPAAQISASRRLVESVPAAFDDGSAPVMPESARLLRSLGVTGAALEAMVGKRAGS